MEFASPGKTTASARKLRGSNFGGLAVRDLALVLTLAGLAPLILRFAFVGIYLWTWMALMNPHRLTYGFAQNQPFNLVLAVLTLGAWIFTTHRKGLKINILAVLLGIFSTWITITTIFAPVPAFTTPLWDRNIKTMLYLFLVMALITNRTRLMGLLWIFVISIGYFGVRGAGFMALTGGNFTVFGPAESMISDNNSLALALILTLPIMNYLRQQAQHKLIRLGLLGAMALVFLSVLGSYSRGGAVAVVAMLGFLWLKSRAKIVTVIVALMALGVTVLFMPQKYFDRLDTMHDLSADNSFQGRLDAWHVAWEVAKERPFGAGFDGPRQPEIWNKYLPEAPARASHSIYFMVVGEHGFVGLFLYLCLLAAAWYNFVRVQRLTRDKPEFSWARDLASALQVSTIGFVVGGAALPMAYYDGFLLLLVAGVPLRHVVERALVPEKAKFQVRRGPAPAVANVPAVS